MNSNKYNYKLDEKDKMEIVKLYESGLSTTQISRIYNVSQPNIFYILKQYNVKRRDVGAYRMHSLNENAFDNIDDEETLYWLGFLTADGHVRSRRRNYNIVIILSALDKQHLEKFRNFIGTDVFIKEYVVNSFGKMRNYVGVTISSKKLVNRVIELGFDKERKNTFPYWMTEERFRDWLRGLIDGDGWVTFSKNRQGHSYLQIGLCGYPELVREVRDWLVRILGVKSNSLVKDGKKIVEITWTGKDAEKIADYIYSGAKVYLDRKYEIYRKWKEEKEKKKKKKELEELVIL